MAPQEVSQHRLSDQLTSVDIPHFLRKTQLGVCMKRSAYRERDYVFGQRMLTLRSAIGLTQAGLAALLGVSRQSVADWETGGKYPKAAHLTQFVALAVTHQAFHVGHEADDIRALWRAAHQKVLLDEVWLSDLLSHVQAAPVSPDVETASAMAARDLRADFPPLRLTGERAVDEPRLILPSFLSTVPPAPGCSVRGARAGVG